MYLCGESASVVCKICQGLDPEAPSLRAPSFCKDGVSVFIMFKKSCHETNTEKRFMICQESSVTSGLRPSSI